MENNDVGIKSIEVRKLFGFYNYDLPKKSDKTNLNKLFILYGDNGSGKTTILNMIFYLLSTEDLSGWKSKIARIKFEKFSILLANGVEIGASRDKSLLGTYTYYVKKNSRIVKEIVLKASHSGSITFDSGSKDDVKYASILKYIRQLNISIYFLSDERKTLHSIDSSEYDEDIKLHINSEDNQLRHSNFDTNIYQESKMLDLDLITTGFIEWIRKQVIQSSKTGETDSLNIYSDLIKSINEPQEKLPSINVLLKALKSLEKQGAGLSNFGLIAPTDFVKIKRSISSIKKKKGQLQGILQLFINSTNARFSALKNLYEVLKDFVESINTFYTNKTLSLSLSEGFNINHESGENINVGMLSSGEKQLLLLFINTITATDQATIFIIDEPEISLNIKWQRMLLKTLLKFSSKNSVQFIIATHSVELLTSDRDNVAKLEK